MTYPFSHHFRKISLEQGFDWEKGWRGNFIEELSISPNPGCLLCSEKNRQQQTHLEETTKRTQARCRRRTPQQRIRITKTIRAIDALLS